MKNLDGNILVLTYWPASEALIQTYTLPYLKIIRKKVDPKTKIWLETMEPNVLIAKAEKQLSSGFHDFGIIWKPTRYYKFNFFDSLFHLASLFFFIKKNNVKILHIWCTPPGVRGYLLTLFTGVTLIIDSYEPHAESMVENGEWARNGIKFKILFHFEKLMSKKASVIISATEGMRSYAKKKYDLTVNNFHVKPACVNLELFSLSTIKDELLLKELNLTGKTIMLYAGKFGGIYLEKEIFELAKLANIFFNNNFKLLLLTSHKRSEIEKYCDKVDLEYNVVISKFVAHADVPKYMGLADFAVTPVKPVLTKRYCTPIKDGEYWALGIPVIITKNISDDTGIIIENNIGSVLNSFDEAEYNRVLVEISTLLKENKHTLRNRIRQVAVKYRNFEIAEKIYSEIYG